MKFPRLNKINPTPQMDLISKSEAIQNYNIKEKEHESYMNDSRKEAVHELDWLIVNFLHCLYKPGAILIIDWRYLASHILHVHNIINIRKDLVFWTEYVNTNYTKFKNLGWEISGPLNNSYFTLKEYNED